MEKKQVESLYKIGYKAKQLFLGEQFKLSEPKKLAKYLKWKSEQNFSTWINHESHFVWLNVNNHNPETLFNKAREYNLFLIDRLEAFIEMPLISEASFKQAINLLMQLKKQRFELLKKAA